MRISIINSLKIKELKIDYRAEIKLYSTIYEYITAYRKDKILVNKKHN